MAALMRSCWLLLATFWCTAGHVPGMEQDLESADRPDTSPVRSLDSKTMRKFVLDNKAAVVFFYNSELSNVKNFLEDYKKAAAYLQEFNIALGMVDCTENAEEVCQSQTEEKVIQCFRDGEPTMSLMMDALYDVEAIIASSLHMAILEHVPLLESPADLRRLQESCNNKCDIVLMASRALGVNEHRIFMEMAFHHRSSQLVFAITPYRSVTSGLTSSLEDSVGYRVYPEDEYDTELWALQCRQGSDCPVANYYDSFDEESMIYFVAALKAPLWVKGSLSSTGRAISVPVLSPDHYHLVYMFHEGDPDSVTGLAADLGRAFRGTVGVVVVDMKNISMKSVRPLDLFWEQIDPPAMAFRQRGKKKATLINHYEDVGEFVLDHIQAARKFQENEENDTRHAPGSNPEDSALEQDDEVAKDMPYDQDLSRIPELTAKNFSEVLNSPLTFVFFYLPWDPVSRISLLVLDEFKQGLEAPPKVEPLYRLNCFDWPDVCYDLPVIQYPTLKIFQKGSNTTYRGEINHIDLMRAFRIRQATFPVTFDDIKELEEWRRGNNVSRDLLNVMDAISLAACFKLPEPEIVTLKGVASKFMDDHLIGCADRETWRQLRPDEVTDDVTLITFKRHDKYQPIAEHKGPVTSEAVTKFVNESRHPVLAELKPENFKVYVGAPMLVLFCAECDAIKDLMGSLAASDAITHKTLWMNTTNVKGSANDKMISSIMETYRVGADQVVEVNLQSGEVRHVPIDQLTANDLPVWLEKVNRGQIAPTVKLRRSKWLPVHPGFDFLRLMAKDRAMAEQELLEEEAEAEVHSRGRFLTNRERLAKKESKAAAKPAGGPTVGAGSGETSATPTGGPTVGAGSGETSATPAGGPMLGAGTGETSATPAGGPTVGAGSGEQAAKAVDGSAQKSAGGRTVGGDGGTPVSTDGVPSEPTQGSTRETKTMAKEAKQAPKEEL